ncbi:protein of unknown function [Candidatus Filomicrobium marinum]|uniref:Uncharacterized protein n=1 Tax=Candidatus Filomicrobium marinum TaxID=1608628 RepID=A0A0D6JBQ5_9HYPH|nr:protein of unknown function [Candidatus Filomicrobium marinum]CPR16601.1 protein of unknown function [Candidatus Filomicrobium marinum]
MIAAVLDLNVSACSRSEAIDHVRGCFGDAHDVVDDNAFALVERQPFEGVCLQFFGVADHVVDLRQFSKFFRFDLRCAARDNDARVGPIAPHFAYGLLGLAHGFGCHRACIDDDRILKAGIIGVAAHHLGLVGVQSAAKGDDGRFGHSHLLLMSGVPEMIGTTALRDVTSWPSKSKSQQIRPELGS